MLKHIPNRSLYDELKTKFPGCDNVWKWFLSLNENPRPSGHTEAATHWIAQIATRIHPDATVKTDSVGNVCLSIPASKGKEHLPAIVLQTHLDMVPTTTRPGFDFTRDLIDMYLEGNFLRARQTTLGADDGSGVAVTLALAEDPTLDHAPLELLFTVDEETGLIGACALKQGELLTAKAKYLINVDSEEFGEICLSCAGGANRHLRFPMQRSPLPVGWKCAKVSINMFKGGHSGCDIHLGRANAIKWIAYMLSENASAIQGTPFRICSLSGGNAHNAVPSQAEVEFAVPEEKYHDFISGLTTIFDALIARWKHVETKPPQLLLEGATFDYALTFSSSRTACRILECIHHGVFSWSEHIETLVETSQSLSIVRMERGCNEMFVVVFARSSHPTALGPVHKTLESITALYGGSIEVHGTDLAGWPAEPNSKLARTAVSVFKSTYSAEPKVTSIHAGLECGVIMSKFPDNDLEAISVGPTVLHPHTTDEALDVPSTCKLYHYMVNLIQALSN
ncbi:aminoacyl-histidine dipeptidase [Pelomyxa schiedti]|nr:aminoacyl-histidine dipeptidase [Pelomyxa schiedti]